MVLLERPNETDKPSHKKSSPEPSSGSRVEENIGDRVVSPLAVEERERLAQFFILLDQMDRAHARMEQERRVA
jgi:hypothetical protein